MSKVVAHMGKLKAENANELLKGIEMLPKRLKRDEDMERAKIDYERLEREIERSNRQRQFEFDFNW